MGSCTSKLKLSDDYELHFKMDGTNVNTELVKLATSRYLYDHKSRHRIDNILKSSQVLVKPEIKRQSNSNTLDLMS
jgi:hypothetical protein